MGIYRVQYISQVQHKGIGMNLNRFLMSFILISFPFISHYANSAGDLLPSEQNTIHVFQKASPNVVYVQRLKNVASRTSKRTQILEGAGSGIVWDSAGHIVTNFHVIYGADKLAVTVGKITVPAQIIGVEPRKDIAVLAVKSSQALKALSAIKSFEMAPTRKLLVGQTVIAIGNPYGFDHSLSTGVISALGRQFPGVGGVSIHDVIQTDAAINPGNSGGPLLDSQGRLIGLNTAIYSQSGASVGIGFAIPSDDIVRVANQIIQHGRVVLSGIGIERADPAIAKRLGVQNGILIANIIPNTPAAKAGLMITKQNRWGQTELGDIVVAINSHKVRNYDSFYNELSAIGIGEEISVTVLRHGQRVTRKMKTIDIAAYSA